MTTARAISTLIGVLNVCSFFSRLPKDGTPVPKHVEVYTYHELYFVICILLCFIERICRLIFFIFNVT
jgi:hypothetical protein